MASKVRAVIGPSPARCPVGRDRHRVRSPGCRPRPPNMPPAPKGPFGPKTPYGPNGPLSVGGAGRVGGGGRAGPVVEGDHHGPEQPGVGGDAVTIGLLVHLRLDRRRQPQTDPSHGLVVLGSARFPERRVCVRRGGAGLWWPGVGGEVIGQQQGRFGGGRRDEHHELGVRAVHPQLHRCGGGLGADLGGGVGQGPDQGEPGAGFHSPTQALCRLPGAVVAERGGTGDALTDGFEIGRKVHDTTMTS